MCTINKDLEGREGDVRAYRNIYDRQTNGSSGWKKKIRTDGQQQLTEAEDDMGGRNSVNKRPDRLTTTRDENCRTERRPDVTTGDGN